MNMKKISKIATFLPLIIVIIGLLFTNGSVWIYFALSLWIILFIFWLYFFSIIFVKILSYSIDKLDTFFEKRRKKAKSQLSNKISNYCNRINKLMYSYVLPFIITLFLFLTILNFSNYMALMSTIKSELNREEFEQLVDEIIEGNINNVSKTKAILAWFDEYSHNIYNDYRLWDQGKLIGKYYDGQIELYSAYPYIGIRTYSDDYALWVLTSRYGHCGEYSAFFRAMANYAGLNVRKVCSDGENHCWDEVFINDTIGWKTVDPTAVFLPEQNGYDNISPEFLRSRLGGNLSYVIATYYDGKTEVITENYTKTINITVFAIDINNNSVPETSIKIFSNNRDKSRFTGLKGITNENGRYTFTIGIGNYTFKAEKENFYGENSSLFNEDRSHYNLTVKIKN